MQDQTTASSIAAGLVGVWVFMALIGLAAFVLTLVINWRVASKAGYAGALSLLILIPFVNFVVLMIFAFGEWPIEQRLRALAGGSFRGSPPPPSQPPVAF